MISRFLLTRQLGRQDVRGVFARHSFNAAIIGAERRVWWAKSGAWRWTKAKQCSDVWSVDFAHDGRLLCVSGSVAPHHVLFDGQQIYSERNARLDVRARLSTDERVVFIGNGERELAYDVRRGRLSELGAPPLIADSVDGQLLRHESEHARKEHQQVVHFHFCASEARFRVWTFDGVLGKYCLDGQPLRNAPHGASVDFGVSDDDPIEVRVRGVGVADARFFHRRRLIDNSRLPYTAIGRRDVACAGLILLHCDAYGEIGAVPDTLIETAEAMAADGWVFVLPHVRGSGELGERWHRDGIGAHRRNAIDDLAQVADAAAAEYNVRDNVHAFATSAAACNIANLMFDRPQLFRSVVLSSPIVDFETQLDDQLAQTIEHNVWDARFDPLKRVAAADKLPPTRVLVATNRIDSVANARGAQRFAQRMRCETLVFDNKHDRHWQTKEERRKQMQFFVEKSSSSSNTNQK